MTFVNPAYYFINSRILASVVVAITTVLAVIVAVARITYNNSIVFATEFITDISMV